MIHELIIGKQETGLEVRPDPKWPDMWRIHFKGEVSGMVNLPRAKDAAIGWARPKGLGGSEVATWHRRQSHSVSPPIASNDPELGG